MLKFVNAVDNSGKTATFVKPTNKTHTMNKLISYTQTSYGTYTVIIEDAYGDRHSVRTHEVEAIDRILEAGRDMASNNDGTYDALRNELADALAAVNNI